MEPHAQDGRHHEVVDRFKPPEIHHGEVEDHLDYAIQKLHFRRREGAYDERPEGIKYWVQEQPDGLEDGVAEEPALPIRWQVRVQAFSGEEPVMVYMVFLERGCHGDDNGDVGPYTKQPVGKWP